MKGFYDAVIVILMQANHKYQDVKFFLIAIAFISAFNYYLTYSNIRFNWFFILTYTIDTVQGWLAWWGVRVIIIYLDKRIMISNPVIVVNSSWITILFRGCCV